MRKFLIIPLLFFASLTVADDVIVSPSSNFQSVLTSLNSELIFFLDYYLFDYQGYIQYISEVLSNGQDSLQQQNIEQTTKIQDLIDNVIYFVEPQLEELRKNSTEEIVPALKQLLQKQRDIAQDVNSLDITVNDGLNDLSIGLENIEKSLDDYSEQYTENSQSQKEYYDSLEGVLNSLQQALVDDVGPNVLGLAQNVEDIKFGQDYLNQEGTQVAVLNAILSNGATLEELYNAFSGFAAGGKNDVTNYFPKEILNDYKSIDRNGEKLDMGWKSVDNAQAFQVGNLNLTAMDDEIIKGGYFEQILGFLKADTKVDIQAKETLLMILKTLSDTDDNSSKAKEYLDDIESQDNKAKRDEQDVLDLSVDIELKDTDEVKKGLEKIKSQVQSFKNLSSQYSGIPSQVYLNFRLFDKTFSASSVLTSDTIRIFNSISSCLSWVYGLVTFSFLLSIFFYFMGLLYKVIINYKSL